MEAGTTRCPRHHATPLMVFNPARVRGSAPRMLARSSGIRDSQRGSTSKIPVDRRSRADVLITPCYVVAPKHAAA